MRYRETKKEESKKDSKFIEKAKISYNSRYKGELSPEKDIVEKPYKATYKSRYN